MVTATTKKGPTERRVVCPRAQCRHAWTPRVPKPRRCPMCWRPFKKPA